MLKEYIEMYKEAIKNGDKKEQDRIQRDLEKLGMDKMTLLILAREEL